MTIQDYLEQRSEFLKTIRPHKGNYRYSSFEEFILNYGKVMKPSITQNFQGLPKSCYYNCQQLMNERLTYVEGYALPDFTFSFPLPHAWLINQQGEVIEPTWEQPGLEYFGVPMPNQWVKSIVESRLKKGLEDVLSIFEGNYLEGFSLLKDGFSEVSD